MRFSSTLRAFFVAVVVALGASSAFAQNYYTCTPTTAGSKWVTIPSTGTTQIIGTGVDTQVVSVTTPFAIPYWGTNYTSCKVNSDGRMCFGSAAFSAYSWTAMSLPISSGADADGQISIMGYDGYSGNASAACVWWVDGTAPNRRFIVAWKNWNVFANTSGTCSYQAQFGENGIITLSYLPNAGWDAASGGAGVGLDKPLDSTQFSRPNPNSGVSLPGIFVTPQYDYQFSALQITGRVLFDRYVTDASGVGNSSEYGLPLSGMTVAELDSTGAVLGTGVTDSAGNFTVYGTPIANGSLAVLSGSTAGNVRKTASGALYQAKFLTGYDFTAPSPIAVGTLTLGEPQDPGGVNRAPINIARTLQTVYDFTKLRLPTKTIQQVDPVLYDPASALPTTYTAKNGATLASMRVASVNSGNSDAWDTSVLRKVYGRHILGAIAADPGAPYDATFDGATSEANAFAEAFGYYMNAIISRETKYFDGVDATNTNTLDMESPPLSATTKGTSSAGWIAAALYDLVDGVSANESWDTFDGTGAAGEQVLLAVATLPSSTPVTSTTFFSAWVAKGYDATALARNFIRHGALVDDADEPNDYVVEATLVPQFGFVRTSRVLNQFNDDFYKFSLPYPTNVLTVDCVYDRSRYPSAQVLVELQSAAGAVLATGAPVGVGGPVTAKSGALPTGDYLIHIKLLAGGAIPAYTLQAFSELAFTSASFPTWTVGRPINVPVNMTGGVPPYDLIVPSPFEKPEGLILDGVNARVAGTPTGPQDAPIPVGGSHVYTFILSAQDSASPTPNLASGSVTFTVNDALKEHFSPFVAFPFGKPVDVPAPFAGGTPPYSASIDEGALPHGLAATGGAALRFTGTPDSPGSYAFTMTGTDIAGSADTASTTGVACVPVGQAALAAGNSSCGFYFDVVKGSTVSLVVTTVRQPGKRAAPRALRATMLDADGGTVLIEPKLKSTRGRVTSGAFVAPSTGRFYFIVSSDDAGAAALLSAKARTVANKGGKGDGGPKNLVRPNVFPVEVGAIAGAVLTFTAKPDRLSGLHLEGSYLHDPDDRRVDFAEGEVTERPDGSITFKRTLPTSGTWKVFVGAKPGPQGKFTYAFTVKEPRGAVYSAD